MSSQAFALQLYTVRDHLEKDTPATLRRVKEIGYDHVELAGIGLYGPREYNQMLSDAGLQAISGHFPYEEVVNNTGSVIETVHALGLRYAVVPWLGVEQCPDKDAWIAAAKAMNDAGARFRNSDIILCYHNHAHEFQRADGQYILDVIFESADAQNLAAELDTYWIKYGGADPADYITQYSGRVPLLHLKDMTGGDNRTFAEMGRGIIEWKPILESAAKAGVHWYIVEQDECAGDSLESARISAEFVRGL
ncbi:MAG: sugar phosphate isomerase [Candidatus Hydrogenedentota bacterium]